MFRKDVLLFCFYIFLIKLLPCEMTPDIEIGQEFTEEDFNALKGPDLCGTLASNTEIHKNTCNRIAFRESLIEYGQNLQFLEGYPKCIDVKVQLYVKNGNARYKGSTPDTKVLDCANTVYGFPLGKGLNQNDLILYQAAKTGVYIALYYLPDSY